MPAGPAGESSREDAARREEREAVRTTIVGGRPPGSGTSIGAIPRGIEVLVKKAAVDPAFRTLLLERRARSADAIALTLTPAEAAMLAAVPAEQLDAIIDAAVVPDSSRRAFMGAAAAAMLAALGVTQTGCPVVTGSRPHDRSTTQPAQPPGDNARPPVVITGIVPNDPATQPATQPAQAPIDNDRPPVVVLGIMPTTRPSTQPIRSAGVRPATP
ncbi:MAG: hypothetical protein BWX88_05179 [Planctomycetes bacterium ADurb.Bin126]|nr:MAG: hypothetical protein BWX88_05179 [Planctomycetes bacterium ADurb.Bin126]